MLFCSLRLPDPKPITGNKQSRYKMMYRNQNCRKFALKERFYANTDANISGNHKADKR